jgi:hypothetical protein
LGIHLVSNSGADSFSSTDAGGGTFDSPTQPHEFIYDVDLSPGETITLTGNFQSSVNPAQDLIDGYTVQNAPTFGTFNFSTTTAEFTYELTYADFIANGGPQTISFQVTDLSGAPDTDVVTFNLTCFLGGTCIAVPGGEMCVEDLQTGSSVVADSGEEVRVVWIGRQTVATLFGPAERLMPVRFAAGSLGGGLPFADLTVTADHGMLVDGVICHAGALVNGTTITRVPLAEMGESYTVYHIETEEHEIILANGAPAETFIDNVSRRVFDNYAEFEALYGDVPEMEELPYPRAMSARQVPAAIRTRLSGKAAA